MCAHWTSKSNFCICPVNSTQTDVIISMYVCRENRELRRDPNSRSFNIWERFRYFPRWQILSYLKYPNNFSRIWTLHRLNILRVLESTPVKHSDTSQDIKTSKPKPFCHDEHRMQKVLKLTNIDININLVKMHDV